MEYEPTSDDIDRILEADPDALDERLAPNPALRLLVEVALDDATMRLLGERAEREGRSPGEVVGDLVADDPSAG